MPPSVCQGQKKLFKLVVHLMANFIEEVEETVAANIVIQTSRYINSTVIRYGDEKLLTFKIFKRQPVPESADDRFMLLEKRHEYRPDVVSQIAYGFPDFWWRILEANNIFDVFDFKAGRTIRIPNNVGF